LQITNWLTVCYNLQHYNTPITPLLNIIILIIKLHGLIAHWCKADRLPS